jgi:hypothetical protein
MIDNKTAIASARRRYLSSLKRLAVVNEVVAKIEPLLPSHWSLSFDGFGLSISSYEGENPKEEFRFVCKLIEIATGIKLNKRPSISGDKLIALTAHGYVRKNDESTWFYVGQYQTDQCKMSKKTVQMEVWEVDEGCKDLVGEPADE